MIGGDDDDDDNEEDLELGQNVVLMDSNDPTSSAMGNGIEPQQRSLNNEDLNGGNTQNTENGDNVQSADQESESKKESDGAMTKTTQRVVVREGLRPYIQIFKNAKLMFSSRRKGSRLKFYDKDEGHIKFEVNKQIEGDVLVRIRHLCQDGAAKVELSTTAMVS